MNALLRRKVCIAWTCEDRQTFRRERPDLHPGTFLSKYVMFRIPLRSRGTQGVSQSTWSSSQQGRGIVPTYTYRQYHDNMCGCDQHNRPGAVLRRISQSVSARMHIRHCSRICGEPLRNRHWARSLFVNTGPDAFTCSVVIHAEINISYRKNNNPTQVPFFHRYSLITTLQLRVLIYSIFKALFHQMNNYVWDDAIRIHTHSLYALETHPKLPTHNSMPKLAKLVLIVLQHELYFLGGKNGVGDAPKRAGRHLQLRAALLQPRVVHVGEAAARSLQGTRRKED